MHFKDAKLSAAAEDERFTHIKHGKLPVPFSTYELPHHTMNDNYQGAEKH